MVSKWTQDLNHIHKWEKCMYNMALINWLFWQQPRDRCSKWQSSTVQFLKKILVLLEKPWNNLKIIVKFSSKSSNVICQETQINSISNAQYWLWKKPAYIMKQQGWMSSWKKLGYPKRSLGYQVRDDALWMCTLLGKREEKTDENVCSYKNCTVYNLFTRELRRRNHKKYHQELMYFYFEFPVTFMPYTYIDPLKL